MGLGADNLSEIGAESIHGGSRALYDQSPDYTRTAGPQRGFGRRVFGLEREETYSHEPMGYSQPAPTTPVVSGAWNTDGHLILTDLSGATQDVGLPPKTVVSGGFNASNQLVLTLADGSTINCGAPTFSAAGVSGTFIGPGVNGSDAFGGLFTVTNGVVTAIDPTAIALQAGAQVFDDFYAGLLKST